MSVTVGAIFIPDLPPEDLRAAALAAENAGIAELWLWEDCFRESAFAAASAVLAWTSRLRVGIGVAPMPLRNVAVTAMEIATVERMFPGRLVPGVGHGVQSWMAQVGARVASPLTLMREYVPALRDLLAGAEVSATGRYVSLDTVKLDWPPETAPRVLAAGEGPKTVHLTGEVADGTILPAGSSPTRVRRTLDIALEGRAAVGRDTDHQLVVFVIAAFGAGDAVQRVRTDLSRWNVEAEAALDVAGTPQHVADAVAEYARAGATSVILQPTGDEPDLAAFYDGVGEVSRLVAAQAEVEG